MPEGIGLLEARFDNHRYLPIPTREPDVPKRYIQDLLTEHTFETELGFTLDARRAPGNIHYEKYW